MIYVLKIDKDLLNKYFSKLKLNVGYLRYKNMNLSISEEKNCNLEKEILLDINTSKRDIIIEVYYINKNYIYYIVYSETKDILCLLEEIDYEAIKDNIYDYKFITIDDFSVVNH